MPSSTKCLLLSLAILFSCSRAMTAQGAQPNAGDYTAALPSVDTIKAQIKGTDPTDTLARQIAVFRSLRNYISNIAYARSVKAPPTPAEQKAIIAYGLAETQLTQSYTSTHTPDEVKAFNQLCGRYLLNQDLYNEYHRLMGKQAVDAMQSAEAKEAQSYQRMQQRMSAGNRPSAGNSAGTLGSGLPSAENDPEIRRCLELGGGTVDDCAHASVMGMSKSAEVAVGNLIGVNVNASKPMHGVILVGSYRSRTDPPELELTPDGKAVLRKCGTLADQTAAYAIRRSGATTQIAVANEPAPILLTLRPDGSLSGPGIVSVKGSVLAGYRNQSNCPVGTPIANCRTTTIPVYSASVQKCTLGQLALQPPPAPAPRPAGLAGMVSDMIGNGTPAAVTYGLRLTGVYASATGMKLTFENRFVTVDCGKAHVNALYTVDNTATGFVARVQNPGGGFQLAVAPDNSLRGAGSATVNGRLVSAIRNDQPSFAPHSETCSVGIFNPTTAPQ